MFIRGITINVLHGIHPVVFAMYVFMRICMICHLDLCGLYCDEKLIWMDIQP